MGTFSQKIHCQVSPCTTAPPTNGPAATDTPVIALKMPMAAPRRSGGNAALSKVRDRGTKSAAPAPWTTRAAISHEMLVETAQAAEDAAKRISPSA